ncbi:MAG: CRISPR-associated helicase Cas3' [Sedimenticola sp.]
MKRSQKLKNSELTDVGSNIEKIDPIQCLAKSRRTSGGVEPGYTVAEHCRIVGEVARELVSRMPEWLRHALYPEGVALVAASHDIGKVCPTFQLKIHRSIQGKDYRSPALAPTAHLKESHWGGHPGVSQLTLSALHLGRFTPAIVGLHHGYSPSIDGALAADSPFGGTQWQTARETLLTELQAQLHCKWPEIGSETQARVVAGLTTVADWIGSSSWFDDPADEWQANFVSAVDGAGFVTPQLQQGLGFEEIFGFTPYESQQCLYQQASQPGVYIFEAPMGLGKTEAALYAAYLALSQGQATGLYFALPTQLTSDKIHERVGSFLGRILLSNSAHRSPLLLHGSAWLQAVEMGEEGEPGHSWFNARKRGILAPFAVGTIDQALMAVMNVRHGFVRAFGLAGKVVILDEVHSYDAYTGLLLDELVATLRKLHCTVIILSATLTAERRHALLGQPANSTAYPLITAQYREKDTPQEWPVAPLPDRSVKIHLLQEDQCAIEEALNRAAEGQQVLWIENSVKEAQEVYRLLSARAADEDIECGLLHSRFTRDDRSENEAQWVELYGKSAGDLRTQRGRILIGTQVLEQSLDIDADFLVSRICPTDMVLQRLGRLWRHQHTARPPTAKHEAWLLAPELTAAIERPYKTFGVTASVYLPYLLCRTLEVWQSRQHVNLPGDIRPLIESTYQMREEAGSMAQWHHELEHGNRYRKGRQQLKQLARVGLSYVGSESSDEQAATRYSDRESVEVLIVRSIRTVESARATDVTLANGETLRLPHYPKAEGHRIWRQWAATLHRHLVTVPPEQAPNQVPRKSLAWLQDYLYLGPRDHETSWLRIALIQPDGELYGLSGGAASGEYQLSYDNKIGYQARKNTH